MATFLQGLRAYAKGFATTLGSAFKKPITVQYPEYKPPVQTRFRGKHLLMRYDNGLERCIGCSLCAIYCPAQAIYVEAAENDPDAPVSQGQRYAARYEINMIRCIFCGYCEEACPVEAVVLGPQYELAATERGDFIYTKPMLLLAPNEPDPRKVAD